MYYSTTNKRVVVFTNGIGMYEIRIEPNIDVNMTRNSLQAKRVNNAYFSKNVFSNKLIINVE